MQKTLTQGTRNVKREACYILRIGRNGWGAPLRVRATHAALHQLLRVLLGGAPTMTLEVRP